MSRQRRSGSVFVGVPSYGGTVDSQFHISLVHLMVWDAKHDRRIIDGGAHLQVHGSDISTNRNQIVKAFLASTCQWLWMVDTDQTFEPDTLDRMLAQADPVERPIIGALVFVYDVVDDSVEPTIWSWIDGDPRRWVTYPPRKLVECGATGAGCVLVHRSVFEKVAAYTPSGSSRPYGETPWPWFQITAWVNPDGSPDRFGEDLTFMARANLGCGIPVHVDTSIEVGHRKHWTVGAQANLERTPFEQVYGETTVIIPVKDKLDLTRSLVAQLREQGGWDRLVVIDNGSQFATKNWLRRQDDITVIDGAGLGIHEMWNRGAELAIAAWPKTNLVFCNNDLRLGDEFLSRLVAGLRAPDAPGAVCPNYDGRDIPDGKLEPVQGICANRYDGTGGLAGFAFAVRGELFVRGYRFPEDAKWWYGDNDLTLTLDRLGVTYGIVGGCTVEHLDGGGQTGDWDSPEMQTQLRHDRTVFLRKWGTP